MDKRVIKKKLEKEKKDKWFPRDRFKTNFPFVYIFVAFIIIFNISARSFQFIKWKKNNKKKVASQGNRKLTFLKTAKKYDFLAGFKECHKEFVVSSMRRRIIKKIGKRKIPDRL